MAADVKAIEIVPTEGGWMLRSDATGSPLFFSSQASAESAAVRLAQGLADAGASTAVAIYGPNGVLARRFMVPALRSA